MYWRVKIDFLRGLVVESYAADGLITDAWRRSRRLLDIVVEKIALPVIVLEAAVTLGRLDHRRRALPEKAQHRVLPQGQ